MDRCEARDAGTRPGLNAVELAILIALIAITAACAFPLYVNSQVRTRVAEAEDNARILAAAVQAYATHTGQLPITLVDLTSTVSNAAGVSAGPFVDVVPNPVPGWTAYDYATSAGGMFTVSSTDGAVAVRATSDGTTVGAP